MNGSNIDFMAIQAQVHQMREVDADIDWLQAQLDKMADSNPDRELILYAQTALLTLATDLYISFLNDWQSLPTDWVEYEGR